MIGVGHDQNEAKVFVVASVIVITLFVSCSALITPRCLTFLLCHS